MALMLTDKVLNRVKHSPADAQAKHKAGKIKSSSNFTNTNILATKLTTLAQNQKKQGSPNIRITNGLISELSNLSSSNSKTSKSYLSELSSGVNSALSLLSSNAKSSNPVRTYQDARNRRPTSVFTSNRPVTQTPTHTTYQEPTIQPHEASNIQNNPITPDNVNSLLDQFGLGNNPEIAQVSSEANGTVSNLTDFAKEHPLLSIGILIGGILLIRGGKKRR